MSLSISGLLALSFSALLLLQSCASAPVMGGIYTDVQYPITATSNYTSTRQGESCAISILGLIAVGDASIEAARRNGGMSTIATVDAHTFSVLGIYASYCVTVRGK